MKTNTLKFVIFLSIMTAVAFATVAYGQTAITGYTLTENCQLTVDWPVDIYNVQIQAFDNGFAFQRGNYDEQLTHLIPPISPTLGANVASWSTWFDSYAYISYTGNNVTFDLSGHESPTIGNYYAKFNIDNSDYYINFQVTQESPIQCSPFNTAVTSDINLTMDFNTKFLGVDVYNTASSSIFFDVDYFLDINEYTPTTRPDLINILTLRNELFSGENVATTQKIILPLDSGISSTTMRQFHNSYISDGETFIDGNYTSFINFWNMNSNFLTFSQTGITVDFEIVGGLVVNVNIQEISTGENISTELLSGYEECSLSNLSGCFSNSLKFLFAPSSNILDKFAYTWELIRTKPPFGYVTSLIDELGNFDTNSTSAFSFGNIPFLSDIFEPFKNLMTIGLWAIYSLYFTGRLTRISL